MSEWRGGRSAGSGWLPTVLACLALLVVPIAAWILLPAAPPLPLPRSASAATAPAAPETAHAPRPASTRVAVSPPPDSPPPPPEDDHAGGAVTGTVIDAEGKPVAAAAIGCADRDTELRAVTDAAGRFELPAEAAGCLAVARERTHSPSPQVALAAGKENTVRMERGGAIEGVVIDDHGGPVASFMIAIESFLPAGGAESPGAVGRPLKVDDAAGAFEWKDLPAGRYVLTASAEGRPPARSDRIDVEPGITTHRVRITLARGAAWSGTLFDADTRKPVAGATLGLDAATQTGANAIPSTTSDADGAFTLGGVPPQGPFSVRITHPGYRTKILTMTLRGGGASSERIALKARAEGGPDSELVGIGAMLGQSPQGVFLQGVIPGGPAARAGLRANDRLALIDGADATVMTLAECVQRLRGPEGTRVAVRVARPDAGTVDVTIVRDLVVR